MPTTPRMQIPYPAENQDPFYDPFVAMVAAIDASLYAEREDRQAVLTDGGAFTFAVDSITGVATLAWVADINIAAPITGFKWFIGAGTLDLLDGEVIFVNLSRAPLLNSAVSAQKGLQVPSSDSDLVIGIRRGNRFYFRNGRVIKDGDTVAVLESTDFGSTGQVLRSNLPIALGQTTAQVIDVVAGNYAFSRNQYLLTGTTVSTQFKTVAFMSAPATEAEIWLWDLTAAAIVAGSTVTVSAITPTEQLVPVTLVTASHMYEVRMKVTTGPASVFCQWAGIEVLNTF